jgi:hypothetical protein
MNTRQTYTVVLNIFLLLLVVCVGILVIGTDSMDDRNGETFEFVQVG